MGFFSARHKDHPRRNAAAIATSTRTETSSSSYQPLRLFSTPFCFRCKYRRRRVDAGRCLNPGAVVRFIMRVIAPLLLLAACHAAQAADVPQPTALPGGFVDTTGQIGVFNTPSGGVQAIELATGKSFFQ